MIEIFKGFVSDADEPVGWAAMLTQFFSVGEPPVRFYYLGFGEQISAGEYIAVAGKRTLFPGVSHVALAYRRLGDMGRAHVMDVSIPGMFILSGILGALGGMFLGPLNTGLKEFIAMLLVLGAFGIWQVWSMRRACRLLDQLESPPSTYSQRQ